jgi:hypothetical protein
MLGPDHIQEFQRLPHEGTSLRDLYQDASSGELEEAAESFDRYLAVVLRVHARLHKQPELLAQFRSLTKTPATPTIERKVEPSQHLISPETSREAPCETIH